MDYPMRINKYLALKNYCSRREADGLIKQGKIKINGRIAMLGDKINEGDKVEVAGAEKRIKELIYLAYNKPIGITTHKSEENQEEIKDLIKLPNGEEVYPVGRLDRASHGLIILTNDGRITDKLLNPKYKHEKEYIVRVNKSVKENFLRKICRGMKLEDFQAQPCIAKQLDEYTFRIILTEGKKHQIRRMCAAFGYDTVDLKRIRITNVKLGNLKPGQYRNLEGDEAKKFLSNLGL